MFSWIVENLGTIIVSLIIAVVCFLIIFFRYRGRKQGKSSCGCDCSSCGCCCKK